MRSVYVSITGFRLKGWRHWPRFWWHTARSIAQARRAHGNLRVEVRIINGVYHTLTIWTDELAMRAFLVDGAHREAMKVYRGIGTGRTLGFTAHRPPEWEAALQRWIAEADMIRTWPPNRSHIYRSVWTCDTFERWPSDRKMPS